ncbi:MAG: SEL1-like repeat protein [Clostridia bacterium]|nr:SEL1-like repeat protein [Clostridia bacterium]
MFRLGDALLDEESQYYDLEKGLYWLEKAADEGEENAIGALGAYYLDNNETEKGIELICKASELGSFLASQRLGKMYYRGEHVTKSYKKALDYFKLAYEQGSNDALVYLGEMYCEGYGVKKDIAKAIEYYTLAADEGYLDAYSAMGIIYSYEEGYKDTKKAIEWVEKLVAETDDEVAIVQLGYTYLLDGQIEKGVELFEEQASQGNGKAMNALGHWYIYDKKNPESSDYDKALKHLEMAVEKEQYLSMVDLGKLYETESFSGYDLKKSHDWYKKAIESERVEGEALAEAYFNLGQCYQDGLGVEINFGAAKDYFLEAKRLGYQCDRELNLLRNQMNELPDSENKMKLYAKEIIDLDLRRKEMNKKIKEDLAKDYSEAWDKLDPQTQNDLLTAIKNYIECVEDEDLSPSTVINCLCGALEREINKHLYIKYLEYLEENGIGVEHFEGKNRTFIEGRAKPPHYRKKDDLRENTLGNFKLLIGLDTNRVSNEVGIDKTFVDFIEQSTGDDAFNSKLFKRKDIEKYFISMEADTKYLSQKFRNKAAHGGFEKVTLSMAETCGNDILMVRKLLIKLVSLFN